MKKNTLLILFILFCNILFSQKFAIIGDCRGGSNNAYNVSNLVKGWYPEFIVTTGDNYIPSSGTIDEQIGQFYHNFIHPYIGTYGDGAAINKFFPALGNHDIDAGTDDYLEYFELPDNERYYDTVIGNVHLLFLNSNISEPDGTASSSQQAVWLYNQLAASGSLWKIVLLHHPPFSSGYHGSSYYMQWPYKDWGASAVIAGHEHSYERLVIDSFPYIVNGTGGVPLRPFSSIVDGSKVRYYENFGAMLVNAYQDSIVFDFYNVKDSMIDHHVLPDTLTVINTEPVLEKFEILTNYPNPFSSSTLIKFDLPKPGYVEIKVYNLLGEEMAILVNENFEAGNHTIQWNPENLEKGLYIYCLYAEGYREIRKAIIYE